LEDFKAVVAEQCDERLEAPGQRSWTDIMVGKHSFQKLGAWSCEQDTEWSLQLHGLLFTMNAATPACRALNARSAVPHFVDARLEHLKIVLGRDDYLE
jgi:hypothetical protein